MGALPRSLGRLLVEHGLLDGAIDVLSGPDENSSLSSMLIRARHPA
ncbi:hypothetical protein [Streptomyces sp. NPDC002825]